MGSKTPILSMFKLSSMPKLDIANSARTEPELTCIEMQ